MLRFSLFKIPIAIEGWFFLLVAFLGGGFHASTPQDWQRVLLFMAAALASILVHELGHALVGLKLGAPSARIVLHGFGGAATFPQARFSRKQSILTTAAGPLASIALAAFSFTFGIPLLSDEPPAAGPLAYFVTTLITINLFWSFVNLCPILPLDGGQILRHLLGPSRLRLTCLISFAALILLALLLWAQTRSLYNLIIMGLLGSYTWKLYQSAR